MWGRKREPEPEYEVIEAPALTDAELRKLSDWQVVALALGEVMEALGIENWSLIDECYRRGTRGVAVAKSEGK